MHLLVNFSSYGYKNGFYDQKPIFIVFKKFPLFLTSIIYDTQSAEISQKHDEHNI